MVMRPAGKPAEEARTPPPRTPLCLRFAVDGVVTMDELGRRWHQLPEAVLHGPAPAALVEPGDDVGEDGLHVLVGLPSGEAVPHPRVELDGLVGARRALVQGAAHLRVRHRVGLAVQDEERQLHLFKNIQKKVQNQS